jgi:integrase
LLWSGRTRLAASAIERSGSAWEPVPVYEKEKGKEFAQKLLGHKSEKMTGKYLDTRGKEYVML